MRFEVYICHSLDSATTRIVLLTDSWKDVCYHTKDNPLFPAEQFIILDNQTPYPLNYTELGFNTPPSETDCYSLVYNCKTVKYKTLSVPEKNFVQFYNFAMELALSETTRFFRSQEQEKST